MFSFKKDNAEKRSDAHFFVGIHISSAVRKLEAAIVSSSGSYPGTSLTLHKSVSFDLPEELIDFYNETLEVVRFEQDADFLKLHSSNEFDEIEQFFPKQSSSSRGGKKLLTTSSLARLSSLRAMTTSVQQEAISELIADSGVSPDQIAVVAINSPNIWFTNSDVESDVVRYAISDGGSLAARTGMNVYLPNFSCSKTQNGHERSFLAFPYWILLSNHDKARLLIDLGENARWTYIPSSKNPSSWNNLIFRDVIPCGSLLNLFAFQASKGESVFDLGGRLSVQGQCPQELLEFWKRLELQILNIRKLPSKYYTSSNENVLNERFYFDSLKSAPQNFSAIDALCCSVYLIAEHIKASVDLHAKLFQEPYDILLTGGAKQNGLLFSLLSESFKPSVFHQLSESGFLEDSFDAVGLAVSAAIFSTGTIIPSIGQNEKANIFTGEVFPGAQDAWKRLVRISSGVGITT